MSAKYAVIAGVWVGFIYLSVVLMGDGTAMDNFIAANVALCLGMGVTALLAAVMPVKQSKSLNNQEVK